MFGSLVRDMERDPIFGAHRAMSRMMNNSFFGDFGGGFGLGGNPMGMMPFAPMGMQMGLHQFPGPGFPNMGQMTSLSSQFGGGPSFSSTSVMSMSMNGNGGEPVIYQASSSTRQVPGGVKETRKTVCDSRSGIKKMSVGRHLGERAHVMEREENIRTGQREENEEFVNLDFDEQAGFEREWRNRVHGGIERRAISGPRHQHHQGSIGHHHHHGPTNYTPSVTIEEVDDNEEESSAPAQLRALPPIPMVSNSHSHHRRPTKDRRHKTASSKRTKKSPQHQH